MYAESAAKGDISQLNSRINLTLSAYFFFLVPVMLFVLCYRQEIIELAFARGAFDLAAVDVTQQLLGFYVIGILFLALRGTVTNVFYSLKDSKTPAKNATVGIVINIFLNLTLPFVMGVNGLALATSLTSIYITSTLLWSLLKMHNELNLKSFFSNIRGIIFASLLAFVIMIFVKSFITGLPNYISLIIGVLVCVIVYFVVVLFIKVPIVLLMKNAFMNRVK